MAALQSSMPLRACLKPPRFLPARARGHPCSSRRWIGCLWPFRCRLISRPKSESLRHLDLRVSAVNLRRDRRVLQPLPPVAHRSVPYAVVPVNDFKPDRRTPAFPGDAPLSAGARRRHRHSPQSTSLPNSGAPRRRRTKICTCRCRWLADHAYHCARAMTGGVE